MGREKRRDVTCQSKQHFSHPHILKLLNPTEATEVLSCNACEKPNKNNNPNFYGCNSCQYFLHENCLNAPRFLDHWSHPYHHLTLLPVPTYTNRSYTCKACGSDGNGYSFSCAACEFDIHLHCALLPQTILLPQHRHELELIFHSPFEEDESTVFVCDLCHDNADLDYWFYYCADCDFGTHLECGNSKPVSQQERERERPVLNKPKANPVIIMKPKEAPTKIQETNQEEEEEEESEENEEAEEEEEEEEEEEVAEEEEEEEDGDEEEEEEEDEDEEEEELQIPRSIHVDKHPHELELFSGSPYEDKDTVFACDICDAIMNNDEWLYYCAECDFVTHLNCASPEADVLPRSQQRQNPNLNPNSAVEMINSASEAHEQIIAAQIRAHIDAQGREAALSLWD